MTRKLNINITKGEGDTPKRALNVRAYGDILDELPVASADTLGGVKVGTGLSVTEQGVLSADSLPVASAETLGGVKVGEGLSVTEEGVLSASSGEGGSVVVVTWTRTAINDVTSSHTEAEIHAAIQGGSDVIIQFIDNATGVTNPLLTPLYCRLIGKVPAGEYAPALYNWVGYTIGYANSKYSLNAWILSCGAGSSYGFIVEGPHTITSA